MNNTFNTLNKPLVSIGVPAYNMSAFLKETLNSIESQTYENIEIIIVDDGSTDGTSQIAEEWKKTTIKKVVVLRNLVNIGLTKSCNILLQHAAGKYFKKLDADDTLHADNIERHVNLLEGIDHNTAFVYSDVCLIDENSELLQEEYFSRIGYTYQPSIDFFEKLLHLNFIPNPSVLIRTDTLRSVGGYTEGLLYEDWDLWLRIVERSSFFYDNHKTCNYRIRNNSMMMDRKNKVGVNNTICKIFQTKIGIDHKYQHIVWKKLHDVIVYSFYLNDPDCKNKLQWYLDKKFSLKIFFYKMLSAVGLKHPAHYFHT